MGGNGVLLCEKTQQSFKAANSVNQEVISPQTRIIYDTKPDEFVKVKEEPKKAETEDKTLQHVVTAVAALAGVVAAIKFGPRAMYAARNVGKKGVQNFLNGNADQKLKDIITQVSENPEIKAVLDKMGVRNIKRIADSAKVSGVTDLMAGRAKLLVTNNAAGGALESVVNFSNKQGFAFYRETKEAEKFARMFNYLFNNVSKEGVYKDVIQRNFIIRNPAAAPKLCSTKEVLHVTPKGEISYKNSLVGNTNMGVEYELNARQLKDFKFDEMSPMSRILGSDDIVRQLRSKASINRADQTLVFERAL